MHAIINKKYVVHLHSISVLSFAVIKNGKKILEKKLKGIKWTWIKYKKPGFNLAFEIKKKLLKNSNVYILQNHGIILTSDKISEINSLIKKIENKLRRKKSKNLKKIKKNQFSIKKFKKPKKKIIQNFAWNKKIFEIIKNDKSLYPDHTVFLNNKIIFYDSINKLHRVFNKGIIDEKKIIIIKNIGLFIKNNISKAEYDMLICLAELLNILPNNTNLSFLNAKQRNELINWNKEKIRQKFNKV